MRYHEICERWIIIWHMQTKGKKGTNDWTQRFRWESLLSPHSHSYCYLKLKCCFSCNHIHSRYSLSLKFFHTLILSLPLRTYDIDPFYCWLLLSSSSSPPPLRRIVFAFTFGYCYGQHHPLIFIVALLSSPVLYLKWYTHHAHKHSLTRIYIIIFYVSFVSVSNIYFIVSFKLSKLNFMPECKLLTLR